MMDATAVEPPEPVRQSTRRRHKPISAISGLVLLCCIALPAVRGCHEPVYPITLPPVWPPYFLGLGFAVAALSGVSPGAITVRVVAALTIVAGGLMTPFAPAFDVGELSIGLVLLGVIGVKGANEQRAVACQLLTGALCLVWFGIWCVDRSAMIGSYVAFGASGGLVLGGVVWLYDLAVADRPEIPEARVIS